MKNLTVAGAAHSPAVLETSAFYRPELDGLRFFAFFAVYLDHALGHFPGPYIAYGLPRVVARLVAALAVSGRFGVTLFFLLSAYLERVSKIGSASH